MDVTNSTFPQLSSLGLFSEIEITRELLNDILLLFWSEASTGSFTYTQRWRGFSPSGFRKQPPAYGRQRRPSACLQCCDGIILESLRSTGTVLRFKVLGTRQGFGHEPINIRNLTAGTTSQPSSAFTSRKFA